MVGEEDERRVDRQEEEEKRGGGAEEDCEKLSCMTVILVDSWSALFHRSPYCLRGGLSGRKQVSVPIASESLQKKSLSPSNSPSACVSYDGPQAWVHLTALVWAHVIGSTLTS